LLCNTDEKTELETVFSAVLPCYTARTWNFKNPGHVPRWNFIKMLDSGDLPIKVTCQREGCFEHHRTLIFTGFDNVDMLSGSRTIGDQGVAELKRCLGCMQVHYCSVVCQHNDWRKRHAVECAKLRVTPKPLLNIAMADVEELKALLKYWSLRHITRGEERAFVSENGNPSAGNVNTIQAAKSVGRKYYAFPSNCFAHS